jgi:hypothetical protein
MSETRYVWVVIALEERYGDRGVIDSIHSSQLMAMDRAELLKDKALADGLVVYNGDEDDYEWDVDYVIESHKVQ